MRGELWNSCVVCEGYWAVIGDFCFRRDTFACLVSCLAMEMNVCTMPVVRGIGYGFPDREYGTHLILSLSRLIWCVWAGYWFRLTLWWAKPKIDSHSASNSIFLLLMYSPSVPCNSYFIFFRILNILLSYRMLWLTVPDLSVTGAAGTWVSQRSVASASKYHILRYPWRAVYSDRK